MALNYAKLKSAGIPEMSTRVSKLVKDRKLKPVALKKINILKDKTFKEPNFGKMTKLAKLPKAPKIALIKKVIKKQKNVGF